MSGTLDAFLGGFRVYRRLVGGKWELHNQFEFGPYWCRVGLWTSTDRRPFMALVLEREHH